MARPRRVAIAAQPPTGAPPYEHLVPIVRWLARHGNRPKHWVVARGPCFFLDRDGWRCDMRKPIDFDLLRSRFTFPPSVMLSEEHGTVTCDRTWIQIAGPEVG